MVRKFSHLSMLLVRWPPLAPNETLYQFWRGVAVVGLAVVVVESLEFHLAQDFRNNDSDRL